MLLTLCAEHLLLASLFLLGHVCVFITMDRFFCKPHFAGSRIAIRCHWEVENKYCSYKNVAICSVLFAFRKPKKHYVDDRAFIICVGTGGECCRKHLVWFETYAKTESIGGQSRAEAVTSVQARRAYSIDTLSAHASSTFAIFYRTDETLYAVIPTSVLCKMSSLMCCMPKLMQVRSAPWPLPLFCPFPLPLPFSRTPPRFSWFLAIQKRPEKSTQFGLKETSMASDFVAKGQSLSIWQLSRINPSLSG